MPKTPSGVGCLEITNPFGLSHLVILPDRGSGSVLILIKLSDIAEILFESKSSRSMYDSFNPALFAKSKSSLFASIILLVFLLIISEDNLSTAFLFSCAAEAISFCEIIEFLPIFFKIFFII